MAEFGSSSKDQLLWLGLGKMYIRTSNRKSICVYFKLPLFALWQDPFSPKTHLALYKIKCMVYKTIKRRKRGLRLVVDSKYVLWMFCLLFAHGGVHVHKQCIKEWLVLHYMLLLAKYMCCIVVVVKKLDLGQEHKVTKIKTLGTFTFTL